MKAIASKPEFPTNTPESLTDIHMERPVPLGRDLLVAVDAISVNPVDTKVRRSHVNADQGQRILGWDAVGRVISTGPDVQLFKAGDSVYYAGSVTRTGSNSEFQLVDERLAGFKPKTLSSAQAAALPLTTLTAWEGLFDRLKILEHGAEPKTLLIIGGAGGVGSMAIQLAKVRSSVKVIATASRAESQAWCKQLGADLVINHHQPLAAQLREQGITAVDYIFCLSNTDEYWEVMAEIIKPQGHICLIVESKGSLDLNRYKNKSATISWEMMFTRSSFQTDDMIEQHYILNRVAALVDEGRLITTVNEIFRPINAANLREAHRLIEARTTIGKIVLEGWDA